MGCKETYDITGMNDQQVIDIIKGIFKNHNRCGGMIVLKAKANKCLVDFVMQATSYFDRNEEYSFVNLQTRCYMIVNDLSEEDFPRCENCGKIIKANVISVKKGFPYKTCSMKCAAKNPKRNEKIAATNAKLGRPPRWSNPEQAKRTQAAKPQSQKDKEISRWQRTVQQHIKEDPGYWKKRDQKSKATNIANGHDANWNNHEQASATKQASSEADPDYWKKISDKAKETKVANGHDANWNNQEKAQETVAKLVEENPDYWKDREKKTKATRVANGHTENWNNSEQRKATCLDKYGVENFAQSKQYAQEASSTCMERYGVQFPMQNAEINKKAVVKKQTKIYQRICTPESEVEPLFSLEEFLARDRDQPMKWRCKQCGTIFDSVVNYVYARSEEGNNTFARCLKCHPIVLGSNQQLEVKQFIESLLGEGFEISYNDRKAICPKEIDIYIPKTHIGFEYDGMYWHSALAGANACAARDKTKMCEDAGIQLFRIYEDEWRDRKDVVQLEIKKVLRIGSRIIDVRACSISEMSYQDAVRCFQTSSMQLLHHFTEFNVGLMHEDNVVAVMSANFNNGKLLICGFTTTQPIINEKDVFEALLKVLVAKARLQNGTHVQIKIARNWPNIAQIVQKVGFELVKTTSPNDILLDCTSWTRGEMNPTKSQLQNDSRFHIDESKTLLENLHANVFSLIYDAGNAVYVKRL